MYRGRKVRHSASIVGTKEARIQEFKNLKDRANQWILLEFLISCLLDPVRK
jgi:hypothetical protein